MKVSADFTVQDDKAVKYDVTFNKTSVLVITTVDVTKAKKESLKDLSLVQDIKLGETVKNAKSEEATCK